VGLVSGNQPILPIDQDTLDPIYFSYRIAQPFATPTAQFTLDPWYRWDAGWYVSIALGQQDGVSGFAPLYPALIRLVTPFALGNPLLAALLISSACFLIALWLLFDYVQNLLDVETAKLTVLLLVLFPFSIFFASAYSESLFLCLTLALFISVKRERWFWVGAYSLLAILTKFSGVTLVIPLGWETVNAFLQDKQSKWLALSSTAVIPVTALVYLGGMRIIRPSSSRFVQTFSWPWDSIMVFWRKFQMSSLWALDWVNLLLLIICLLSIFYMIKKFPPVIWLYASSSIAILLLIQVNGDFLIFGLTRYVLVIFPFFVVWANWLLPRRWIKPFVLTGSVFAQMGVAWLYTRWYFVG